MRILLLVGFSILWMSSVYAQEICNNAIDDDADGLIDLNDGDCICDTIVIDSVSSLIPNSSFEAYYCLPSSFGAMDCATDWIQAGAATSDYLHTASFYDMTNFGVPLPPMPIPDGEGFVGFIDAGDLPSWAGTGIYKEYVGACLLSPLLQDTSYTFNFYVGFGAQVAAGFDYAYASDTLNMGFYASSNCSDLPFGGGALGCPSDYPEWDELGTLTMWGNEEWVQGSFTFIPTQDYNTLIIGPSCDVSFGTPTIDYGDTIGYFFLDELTVNNTSLFSDATLASEQLSCEDYILSIEEVDDLIDIQWYLDGIALIGETSNSLSVNTSQTGAYQVSLSDGLSCSVSNSIFISTFSPEIDFSFSGDFDICAGESTTISVTGNFDGIDWAGEDVTSVTYTEPTTDFITFTNAQGCSTDTTITISSSAEISYEFVGDFDFCEGESTTISVSGSYDNLIWNGSSVSEVSYMDSQSDQIIFSDASGCSLDTVIQITEYPYPELDIEQGNQIMLNFGDQVALNLITDVTDYTISWDPAEGLSCSDCIAPTVLGFDNVAYIATIIDNESGCSTSINVSVQVLNEVFEDCEIWLPNSFTPNDDGSNDTFGFYAPQNCLEEVLVFQVYNRWGERVFSNTSKDMNISSQWDGTYKGQKLTSGVFVWQVAVKYLNGEEGYYKGNVTLIR